MINTLREDWERLDKVEEALSDGLEDYLNDGESLALTSLLNTIRLNIRDLLSVKEISRLGEY